MFSFPHFSARAARRNHPPRLSGFEVCIQLQFLRVQICQNALPPSSLLCLVDRCFSLGHLVIMHYRSVSETSLALFCRQLATVISLAGDIQGGQDTVSRSGTLISASVTWKSTPSFTDDCYLEAYGIQIMAQSAMVIVSVNVRSVRRHDLYPRGLFPSVNEKLLSTQECQNVRTVQCVYLYSFS